MRTVTRPTRLDGLSPVEVAGRLRHLPGLVFFDTAGNFPLGASRPVSVIAARPERIVEAASFLPPTAKSSAPLSLQGRSWRATAVSPSVGFAAGSATRAVSFSVTTQKC